MSYGCRTLMWAGSVLFMLVVCVAINLAGLVAEVEHPEIWLCIFGGGGLLAISWLKRPRS